MGQIQDGSGGPKLMPEAGITILGVAESCLHSAHISPKIATQLVQAYCTCSSKLHTRQEYIESLPQERQPLGISEWCEEQTNQSPALLLLLLLKLKLPVVQFMRSVRTGNRDKYDLSSITKITHTTSTL